MIHQPSIIHQSIICEAIQKRACLRFQYQGLARVVAPYCHGFTKQGVEVLRAIQLSGGSHRGGLGFGKLWVVAAMQDVAILPQAFLPDDPNYNPRDTALRVIHCHV